MPRGPLGFPRLTDKGPLVDSIEPTINLEPGTYHHDKLEELQQQTAQDSVTFMSRVMGAKRPTDAVYIYDKYSIDDIVIEGGFIPTLSRFVGDDPSEVGDMVRDGDIDNETISSISAGFPHHLSREEVAEKMEQDIVRVNMIYESIDENGEYWPPTFKENESTIDGAHRVASLYHFTGMRNKIYAWKLDNPMVIEMR